MGGRSHRPPPYARGGARESERKSIVTEGAAATRVAKEATTTIPIVVAQDPDPVGTGYVVSLARPGGNITGLCHTTPRPKRKTDGPSQRDRAQVSHMAILGTSSTPVRLDLKETERGAGGWGYCFNPWRCSASKDIENNFEKQARAVRCDPGAGETLSLLLTKTSLWTSR